jgi:hypothetical protein
VIACVHGLVQQMEPERLARIPVFDSVDRSGGEEICVVKVATDKIYRRFVIVPHIGNAAVPAARHEPMDVRLATAKKAEVAVEAAVDW